VNLITIIAIIILALYNIGDEIDVIIYNNKKYVKLKEYEINI